MTLTYYEVNEDTRKVAESDDYQASHEPAGEARSTR
jgi:hypothetical protein